MAQLSLPPTDDLAVPDTGVGDIYRLSPRHLAAGLIGGVGLLFALLLVLASPQPEGVMASDGRPTASVEAGR